MATGQDRKFTQTLRAYGPWNLISADAGRRPVAWFFRVPERGTAGGQNRDGENNETQRAFTPISPARVLLRRVLNSLCFSVKLCVLCG